MQIKGYRELDDSEVELINSLKLMGDAMGKVIRTMELDPSVDQRWVAIGKTHIQQGMMALVRSVAKPEGF